jgi:hypothetical protein
MNKNKKRSWVPEIVYEDYEEGGLTDGLPFINVPKDSEMPSILFFLSTKETGEFEPDSDGEPQPIVEVDAYQYACMKYLEEELSLDVYDQVRHALGLEPKLVARKKGMVKSKEMLDAVQEKYKNN